MVALTTEVIVQRIIDILKASTTPDLRLNSAGGPIRDYVFGIPEEEIPKIYPIIWVAFDSYEEAGFGETTRVANIATVQVGIIEQHRSAQTVEKNAIARHDDVRVALRATPNLDNGSGALAEKLKMAWASFFTRGESEKMFVIEVTTNTRWLVYEDV